MSGTLDRRVCGSLHAKKEQGGEKSFLPASSFYFFYTFSPAGLLLALALLKLELGEEGQA